MGISASSILRLQYSNFVVMSNILVDFSWNCKNLLILRLVRNLRSLLLWVLLFGFVISAIGLSIWYLFIWFLNWFVLYLIYRGFLVTIRTIWIIFSFIFIITGMSFYRSRVSILYFTIFTLASISQQLFRMFCVLLTGCLICNLSLSGIRIFFWC